MVNFLSNLSSEERTKFYLSCIGFMCVASSALIARTVGDTLFLSQYSLDSLSYMYVGTAIIVGIASYIFGILIARVSITKLIFLTSLLLTISVFGLWILLAYSWGWLSIAAYFMGDLIVNIPMILFWTLAALIFNPREAKRLFGYVGAAGTAACILAGYFIRFVVPLVGARNLFLPTACLLVLFTVVIHMISKREKGAIAPVSLRRPGSRSHVKPAYFMPMLKSEQIRSLTFMVLAGTIAITLTDFQFKASSRMHFQGLELAGFFGSFYGTGNVVALVIQLFIVYHIFKHGGLLLALRILPAGLLLTSAATLLFGSFTYIIASRFLVQILAFTIDIAAIQLLYLGINKPSRSQTRAFVDGVVKPSAIAISGILMIGAMKIVPIHWLAGAGAAGAIAWLLLTKRNHDAYVSSLVDSIHARRIDLSHETSTLFDKAYEKQLRTILLSAKDDDLPYTLNLISELPSVDWSPEFHELLNRENVQSKIAAIKYFNETRKEEYLPAIIRYVHHSNSAIRTEAINAMCAIGTRDMLQSLAAYFDDNDISVRIAVIAGLLNRQDRKDYPEAQTALASMVESGNAELRIAAAKILGQMKHNHLFQPLACLLDDPEPLVRKEALQACRNHPDSRYLPSLLCFLDDPRLRSDAEEILVRFGPTATHYLISYLQRFFDAPPSEGTYRIPVILARIGDPMALSTLLTLFKARNLELRRAAVTAYCLLIRGADLTKESAMNINNAVFSEIDEGLQLAQPLSMARHVPHGEILVQALQEGCNAHIKNILTLLDVIHPEANMKTLYDIIKGSDQEKRASALEVLDNVLSGKIRALFMRLLEPERKALPSSSVDTLIHSLCELTGTLSDWIEVGILYAIGKNKLKSCGSTIIEALKHPNQVIREAALFALKETEGYTQITNVDIIRQLIGDSHPGIQRMARELFSA